MLPGCLEGRFPGYMQGKCGLPQTERRKRAPLLLLERHRVQPFPCAKRSTKYVKNTCIHFALQGHCRELLPWTSLQEPAFTAAFITAKISRVTQPPQGIWSGLLDFHRTHKGRVLSRSQQPPAAGSNRGHGLAPPSTLPCCLV